MEKISKNKELISLVSLIDEPDDRIYEQIKDKILSFGLEVIPVLENVWENTFDNVIQQRIETIIHTIQFDNVFDELKKWMLFQKHDLLRGFLLVTKYQYPDLDEEKIIKEIGKISQDVWLELNKNLTALENVKVFNHILYDLHGFRGNKKNFHAPQNMYINNVLETKKGNPLSLSIIYSVIAQSLKIPVYGVNLPEYFILAYAKDFVKESSRKLEEAEVLFYINAFNKGAVFSINELNYFIKQLKLEPEKKYYVPCNNVETIQRLIFNLISSYEKLGYPDKVKELEKLRTALD